MQTLLMLLVIPFMALNLLGWVIALIWLMILGEWGHIGSGILVAALMPFAFAIAMLPGMAFTAGFAYFAEKNFTPLALVLAFLSSVYTHVLVMVWLFFVFFHYARSATDASYIPLLLWGYCVAMGPLVYMAKYDGDNPFTSLLLFLAQVAYVGLVVCFIVGAQVTSALIFLGVLVLLSTTFAMAVGISTIPRRRASHAEG